MTSCDKKKNNPADPKLLLVLMLSCKSLLSHILMGKKIRVNFERIFANISLKLWTNPNISPFREALLCILHHEPVEIWSMSTFFNSSKSELRNLGGKIRGFWLVALIVQFSPPLPRERKCYGKSIYFPKGFHTSVVWITIGYHRAGMYLYMENPYPSTTISWCTSTTSTPSNWELSIILHYGIHRGKPW